MLYDFFRAQISFLHISISQNRVNYEWIDTSDEGSLSVHFTLDPSVTVILLTKISLVSVHSGEKWAPTQTHTLTYAHKIGIRKCFVTSYFTPKNLKNRIFVEYPILIWSRSFHSIFVVSRPWSSLVDQSTSEEFNTRRVSLKGTFPILFDWQSCSIAESVKSRLI